MSDLSAFICFVASCRSTFCVARPDEVHAFKEKSERTCVVSGHVIHLYPLSAALFIFCKAQREPQREGDAERSAEHTSPVP